jgi:glucose/arabinose dehydrogenase
MVTRMSRKLLLIGACAALIAGCARGPTLLSRDQQKPIDRALVEYPTNFELRPYIDHLNAPTAIAFDSDRSLLIAEGGIGDNDPKIFGYTSAGQFFQIYPTPTKLPIKNPLAKLPGPFKTGFEIYGPIGGMIVDRGRIYVSHRDSHRRGVITAFDYAGNHTTIVADLPAQGDYSVTDLAIGGDGRLYFGVGTATNSGVVGIDNWQVGWVNHYRNVCDQPLGEIKLLGYRFDAPNPRAGLFGGGELAVTAPFQPFGTSNELHIHAAANGKPSGAIYSVSPAGGDLRVEAHGIHNPRGLGFNEFGRLYFTNCGMELRGTRPVRDDPDALMKFVKGAWYGWPDYSADLQPISDPHFQPPVQMVIKSGYREISALIDHAASNLQRPDRGTLLQAAFPALSGAAKMDFVPASGPFNEYRGSVIIAMSGDRAPFATGGSNGLKLQAPIGYKVVRVDVDSHQVKEFIRNTENKPASKLGKNVMALERPIDVKFGPDGSLYILDFGQLEVRNGKERITDRTGRVFRLVPVAK